MEFLGIGVYASKKCAPEVEREELTGAMRKVLGSKEMRGKAKGLGEMCRARKGGREVAADLIEEIICGFTQSSKS